MALRYNIFLHLKVRLPRDTTCGIISMQDNLNRVYNKLSTLNFIEDLHALYILTASKTQYRHFKDNLEDCLLS